MDDHEVLRLLLEEPPVGTTVEEVGGEHPGRRWYRDDAGGLPRWFRPEDRDWRASWRWLIHEADGLRVVPPSAEVTTGCGEDCILPDGHEGIHAYSVEELLKQQEHLRKSRDEWRDLAKGAMAKLDKVREVLG